MAADLSPLAPYVPFDLMVWLSTLSIRFADVVDEVDYPYAVIRGRLPRTGLLKGVYNGWGDRGHELVIDISRDSEPRYYGESARDMAGILTHVLQMSDVAPWHTRIRLALAPTSPTTEYSRIGLEELGFEPLRRGLYVYMQARTTMRKSGTWQR